MPRPLIRLSLVLASVALAASACGAGDEAEASAADSGVASIDDVVTTDDEAAEADTELAADEAALAFSACMRDEGLDFPDIGVDAEGNLNLREAFGETGVDPRSAEFQAGMEACGEFVAAAGFGGGGGRAALADNTEVQDALVAFSECLRDAGYDVGDLTLGGPGQAGQGQGQGQAPDGDGQQAGQGPGQRGEGEGGFGDRNARFAAQLGLDIDDPDVAADIESCIPILDTALAEAGVGGPGGQP